MVMNEKITELVSNAEKMTDAQIVVLFADRASHYRIVPWIYATLIALPLAFLLYEFTNLPMPVIFTAQLLSFLVIWGVVSEKHVKRILTFPKHKTARITQRTRDLLWSYQNLNANPRPLLLVFIADYERMVGLKSTCLSDEILASALPIFTQNYKANPEKAIEAVLANLTPHLALVAPKTGQANGLDDSPSILPSST
jgi:uncharacterized membrane protein